MQHIFVELRDKFFCNFFVLIPANASVAPIDWNSFIGKFKYQLSRFNKPFYRLCRYGNLTQSPSNITYVDLIQVGARNMQNFDLLRELGKLHKPVLLKRGLASTLKELLMSAEYIMAGGNEQVILCERGIRTYDDYTRNTLDLAAVPMLKELTHLPVIVDPSHATGIARLVRPMALAAAACGSDGLIIEVHNDPLHALCDGAQSLRPEVYDDLAKKVRSIREVITK